MQLNAPLDTHELLNLLFELLVALGSGTLIGLEREFSHRDQQRTLAGTRTFALMSVFGFLSAMLGEIITPWIPVTSMLGMFFLGASGYFTLAREGRKGITTEVSLFITFLLGLLAFKGFLVFAVVVALLVSILLSLKPRVRTVVGKLTEEELYAVFKFLLVTVLVLPNLPNYAIDPLGIINPLELWSVVVAVLGLSFVGYILIKFWGTQSGIMVTGFLGGLVSSTIITWVFSRQTQKDPGNAGSYARANLLAIAIMFARILVLIIIINPYVGFALLPSFCVLTFSGLLMVWLFRRHVQPVANPEAPAIVLGNPFNLFDALKFGALYCAILSLVFFANREFGSAGVYIVSLLSGLLNLDAISISMARLAGTASLHNSTALNAIMLAAITNNCVKLCLGMFFGHPIYRKVLGIGIGVILAATIAWTAAVGW